MVWIYQASLYCDACGPEMVAAALRLGGEDTGDSDAYPQAHEGDPGPSDSVDHCASGAGCADPVDLGDYGLAEDAPLYGMESRHIGALLTEQLTDEGAAWLHEVTTDPAWTPYQNALHRFWRAAFADELEEDR